MEGTGRNEGSVSVSSPRARCVWSFHGNIDQSQWDHRGCWSIPPPARHGEGGAVPARTPQDVARRWCFPVLLMAGIPRCSWGTSWLPGMLPVPIPCRSFWAGDCMAWFVLLGPLCWSALASGGISALSSALFSASSPASLAWEGSRFASLCVSL